MRKVIISLGSNLGNRGLFISSAITKIEDFIGPVVLRSSVIETPSWGFESYPFLNQIIVAQTHLSPLSLLNALQDIERNLGRTEKSSKDESGCSIYHAREIDLDILDYDGVRLNKPHLTLPHPHIYDRDSIVTLLNELNIEL